MAQDIQDSKKKGLKKLQNAANFAKAQASIKLEDRLQAAMGQFDSLKDKGANLIPYFLDLLKVGGGNDTIKRVRKKVTSKLGELNPELKEIIFEELIKFLNCNLEFVVPSNDNAGGAGLNQIKVDPKSIDPFDLLKVDPNSKVGKYYYEKNPLLPNALPYPTNKELFSRLESQPIVTTYQGASGQNLFDIAYDGTDYIIEPIGIDGTMDDNSITPGNDRNLTLFLRDYFDSIDVFQKHDFTAVLMDMLSGVISVQIPKSDGNIQLDAMFQKLLDKLLALCGDAADGGSSSGDEFSISGIGHLSEDLEIDDDFFDFGEQDLRDLEDETSLKVRALLRLVDCGSVTASLDSDKLDVDLNNIINQNNPMLETMGVNDAIDNMSEDLQDRLHLPNIDVAFNLEILKAIPKVILSLVLSPKILLPIAIAIKSLGNTFANMDIVDLLKNFRKLIGNILKRIKEWLLEILFEEIKRIILKYISMIMKEVISEKYAKIFIVVQSLINQIILAIEIAQALISLANCRNALDALLALLKLPAPPGGVNIPQPLLFATAARPGFSDTRAFQNVLENFQDAGLNTDDHSDGSPNEMVLAMYHMIKGVELERAQNSCVKLVTYPQTVIIPGQPPGKTAPGSGTGLAI